MRERVQPRRPHASVQDWWGAERAQPGVSDVDVLVLRAGGLNGKRRGEEMVKTESRRGRVRHCRWGRESAYLVEVDVDVDDDVLVELEVEVEVLKRKQKQGNMLAC